MSRSLVVPPPCEAWDVHWPDVPGPALLSAAIWASSGTLRDPISGPRSQPRDPGNWVPLQGGLDQGAQPTFGGGGAPGKAELTGCTSTQVPNSPTPRRQSSRAEWMMGVQNLSLSLSLPPSLWVFRLTRRRQHCSGQACYTQVRHRLCRPVMTRLSPKVPQSEREVQGSHRREGQTTQECRAGLGEEVKQGLSVPIRDWEEHHRQREQRGTGDEPVVGCRGHWRHLKVRDPCGAGRGDPGASRELLAEQCSAGDGRPPRGV